MRSPFTLSVVFACLVAAVPVATAQNVSVTGQVEALAAAEPCAPGATHRIRYTDVFLRSTTVDLNTLFGSRTLIGIDVSGACPLIDVTSVKNVAFSLSVCNHPGLGCTVTLDMCPAPNPGSFLLLVSAQTGYLPVDVQTGSLLLGPPLFTLAVGATTAVCQSLPITLNVPASLVGFDVFFQGASLPPLYPALPALFSNVTKMTIQPAGGCTNFACF